jgi:hypothetical protein
MFRDPHDGRGRGGVWSTVPWKLQSPDPQELACVAEELALNAIVGQAQALLETCGKAVDLGDVYEWAFQDTDFAFLFDVRFDGIEESELADPSGWRACASKTGSSPSPTCLTSIPMSRTRARRHTVGDNDRRPRGHPQLNTGALEPPPPGPPLVTGQRRVRLESVSGQIQVSDPDNNRLMPTACPVLSLESGES